MFCTSGDHESARIFCIVDWFTSQAVESPDKCRPVMRMVSIAENARIPIDNPATHLELTMVHEAMVLEYSGRHLALIDLASELKLLFYMSVIACLFIPWGIAPPDGNARAIFVGMFTYLAKLAVGGVLLAVFETSIAKMRVFRVPAFLGAALMLGLLGTLLLFVSGSL